MTRPKKLPQWIALALVAAFFTSGCSTAPTAPRLARHVVLMWLKHPRRAADRAQLVRAARGLRMIPGVLDVETGRDLPSAMPPVEPNFDLAVVITFRDRAALARFEKSPRHHAALGKYLRPLVRRSEAYDLDAR